MRRVLGLVAVSLALGAGCAAEEPASVGDDTSEVTVDTSTPEARRQYDANVAFASGYAPRCRVPAGSTRPRVLVTGFGRFMTIANNATGRIVSTLVPAARYPETEAPAPGEVDRPEPQLSVATATLDLPDVGLVDLCAMILPVYWDLASVLIAKEADSFRPSFVMMNGVAGSRQPIWIELGATNRASKNFDGSDQLRPAVGRDEDYVKLIESAPATEDGRGNLLSWTAVRTAARAAVRRHERDREDDTTFGQVLSGASLAGFPRPSNTYLCNNVTYVTGWLMSHPGREVRLLRASQRVRGGANEVRVKITSNLSTVPRVFVHWPSELADKHHAAGADVMKSIIAAQLRASRDGDAPTIGGNDLADPTLQGNGSFF
jgi:pyrrolidone-carboxylate peptidase